MARLGQFRRDTAANWTALNPVIADGEFIMIATNPGTPKLYDQYKVGDGTSTYSQLPYKGLPAVSNLNTPNTTDVPSTQLLRTELVNKGVFNVDLVHPLSAGNYYTPTTARAAVDTPYRNLGQIITYSYGVKEVNTIAVTAIPTSDGNITFTLNGVTTTVALLISAHTTTALVAQAIAAAVPTGWTAVVTSNSVAFTKTTIGICTAPVFSGGTTGTTATATITIAGVNKIQITEQYDGTTWTSNDSWRQVANSDDLIQLSSDLNKSTESITQLETQLDTIYNGTSSFNQINQIGTMSPSMWFLQNANEEPINGGYPKVENIVDTESPFKDILGYYTRFINTQTSNSSNYKFENIEVRTNRPSLLSIGFWVKKSQFTGINFFNNIFFASYTNNPVVLFRDDVSISQLVDGNIGVKITQNITSDLFDSTREMYKAFEVGDWCQIIINYKSIVWDVADGTKWEYGFGFNDQQSKWVNQSKDYANFQISEGKELPIGIFVIQDVSNSMIVFPHSFKDVNNLIDQNTQSIAQLDEQIQSLSKKTNLLVYDKNSNANSYVQSPFNSTYDLRLYFVAKRTATSNNNPCFNFSSVSLINKTTLAETSVHSNGDDITPAYYNGTYIGANHGCSDLRAVTANNHGKTFADIGSEWSNGTYKFYIIGIIDVNTLWILGENSKVYPLWSFRTVATGNTLTHVSGATNTSNITVSNSTMSQFYPSLFVSDLKLIADGIQITESGTYNFDELNICETYDVFNVASTLEKIKALVGAFAANPIYNQLGADKVARHSLNYKFVSADKCLVNTNFVAYQNIEISYFGFMQQGVLSGNNVKMYIPKALPVMDGAIQKDFRTIVDHNVVSETIDLVAEYWENPLLPPDRYIQASENIVFNGGYLFDFGVGGTKRKDLINNAFFIYTSRKVYPYGIDSKITVNAGSKYNAVCFRVYTDVQKFNVGGIINQNLFEYEGNLYMYSDFNNYGFFEIDIPDKFIGKNINVLEKSTNIDILSETANSKILVKVNEANPMYAYAILKI